MAVYSMTGYASAQTPTGGQAPARLGLEIRSVNSRFLDLTLRLPDELRSLEPALRQLLTQQLKRGKVELRAHWERQTPTGLTPPSGAQLAALAQAEQAVMAGLPQARPLSVADALRLLQHETPPSTEETAWLGLAEQALQALRQARAREGERLAQMLQSHIAQLQSLAAQAEPLVPQLVAQQRQKFLERWQEAMQLADGQVPPAHAQERALAEATAFAIRIDVAEELTRLQAHLQEIAHLLQKGGELGKRLDFLIQELHREANTLGSKSALLEMTRISVDMKVLIEQMREQVQNIE